MRWWQLQDFAQFTMDIMWCLCGRPECDLASNGITWIGLPTGNTGVSLHRSVIIALVIEPILANVVGCRKTSLDITKIVSHGFVNIANSCLVVNLPLCIR